MTQSIVCTPSVKIVQERPVPPTWLRFLEEAFDTVLQPDASADAAAGGVAPGDFVILHGRPGWAETWIRNDEARGARPGLLVVLKRWSGRAAAQMLWLAADDVVGPCADGPEICARIHAIMRRGTARRPVEENLPLGIRRAERKLLDYLRASRGRVVTHGELLANVFGGDRASGTSLVRVHVSRLRRRLAGVGELRTIRGAGYVLDPDGGHPSPEENLPRSA